MLYTSQSQGGGACSSWAVARGGRGADAPVELPGGGGLDDDADALLGVGTVPVQGYADAAVVSLEDALASLCPIKSEGEDSARISWAVGGVALEARVDE